MVAITFGRARVLVAAFVLVCFAGTASTQQTPSSAAIATAKEVIMLKMGGMGLWEPVVPGVVEQAKNVFLQMNPMLFRDLNEVAARLRSELAPRQAELSDEIARLYAARFTEQELRDVLAFYRSTLGRKVIAEEPKVLDAGMTYAQNWANKLSEEVLAKIRAEMKKKGHDL